MISYEATVCCDGQNCQEHIAGENKASQFDARVSASGAARRRGWRTMPGLHVCPACAKKRGLHVQPNPQ